MAGADGASARPAAAGPLVLDTNIVLDLLVFDDPATHRLKQLLAGATVYWLATGAMRGELQRVLAYRPIAARLVVRGLDVAGVLAQFDGLSHWCDAPTPATIRCRDRDDQIFIDLAVAHRATLLSKDLAVLGLDTRLARVGARALAPGLDWPVLPGEKAGVY